MRAYGEDGVEHEYTVFCPFGKVAAGRRFQAEVSLHFLIDIDEGWRRFYAVLHTEAKAMRLPFVMIRILAKNNYLYFIERSFVECVEDFIPFGIDCFTERLFMFQEHDNLFEIRFLEFVFQYFLPA